MRIHTRHPEVLSDRVFVRDGGEGGGDVFHEVVWLVVSHCQFQTNVRTWPASSSVQLTSSDFFVCVLWFIPKQNLLLIIPEFSMEVQQKSALGRSPEIFFDQSYGHLLDYWDVYRTGLPNAGYISMLTCWSLSFRLLNCTYKGDSTGTWLMQVGYWRCSWLCRL